MLLKEQSEHNGKGRNILPKQKSICFIEQQKDIVYTTYEVFFSIMQILLESVVKEERVFEPNPLCSMFFTLSSMFLCIMRT